MTTAYIHHINRVPVFIPHHSHRSGEHGYSQQQQEIGNLPKLSKPHMLFCFGAIEVVLFALIVLALKSKIDSLGIVGGTIGGAMVLIAFVASFLF